MYQELLRFLAMTRHRLGAADARAEIGGRNPTNPRLVWAQTPQQLRIVLEFAEPPSDGDQLKARLAELVEAFVKPRSAPVSAGPSSATTQYELDAALRGLTTNAGALAAMITDEQSPIVWGWSLSSLSTSSPRTHQSLRTCSEEVDNAERAAACSLVQALSTRRDPRAKVVWLNEPFGLVWRKFCGSYCVWLTFEGRGAALRAEAALIRGLLQLENLMEQWPPTDPDGPGMRRAKGTLRLV